MALVYKHTTPDGLKYIGMTIHKNPEVRWQGGFGYKDNQRFWNAIIKNGWGNIKHEIVRDGLTKTEAEKLERQLIISEKTENPEFGYNQTNYLEEEERKTQPSSPMISVIDLVMEEDISEKREIIRKLDSQISEKRDELKEFEKWSKRKHLMYQQTEMHLYRTFEIARKKFEKLAAKYGDMESRIIPGTFETVGTCLEIVLDDIDGAEKDLNRWIERLNFIPDDEDIIGAFEKEVLIPTYDKNGVPVEDAYKAYSKWIQIIGKNAISKKEFLRLMKERGFLSARGTLKRKRINPEWIKEDENEKDLL